MVGGEDEQNAHLLTDIPSSSSLESNGPFKRTGTVWTAIAHVITGVMGSGVVSLAWSVAQLGWIAGPLCMVIFGVITIISSNLLCDCYRYPDPEFGPTRNRSYAEAVNSYLGRKSMWVCGVFAQVCFYGYGIAYTITCICHQYEIYSQPLFAAAEKWVTKSFPKNGFVNNNYTIKIPLLPALKLNLLRLCFRTAYVLSTTGIALAFPYFNQVLGVLGALNFWPLAIYFPVEMYLVQRKRRCWTKMWIVFQTFRLVFLLVTVVAFIGSVEGLISNKLS